jgi:hypothetical protein
MHFNPTSLINSAVWTASALSLDVVARLNSSVIDSGEFIVIVAAVFNRISICSINLQRDQLTDSVSQDSRPSFWASASLRIVVYTERIFGVAGSVFGRAWGALMSALSLGESLDMM